MQLSQLFRRGIVVPLTDATVQQLASWSVTGTVRVEYLPIPDESLFEQIWNAGVLQAVNERCSTAIDDYEEERVGPEVLELVIASLVAKQQDILAPDVSNFVDNLIDMCKSAIEKQRPLYFVL